MSRLIDANKFEKYLLEKFGPGGDSFVWFLYGLIAEQPTVKQDNWIPCSDGLPDKEKDVRVQLSNGLVFQGFIDDNGWNLGCSSLMCLPINCVDTLETEELKVIAWQPLPQPYKEADSK